jgi:uncharacterized protein YdaU (DUF1376 family)
MNKSPAFQFYAADFLIGVMGMSDEEIGIYIKMLATQWERGFLPNDQKMIKKLINSRKIPSEIVMHKFALCEDGFLRNLRLEKEREKQKSFKESRVANANKRWEKEKKENAPEMHVHNASICETHALQSSSSSSSSILELERTPARKSTTVKPETTWPVSASERGGGMDAIMKRINSLRPEWQLPAQWNAAEMHMLHGGSAAQICELTDSDWLDLTTYMAAKNLPPKDYWQPRSRLKFVETFSDVCGSLQRWREKGNGAPKPNGNPYY